jgi:flagellar motor component MotA
MDSTHVHLLLNHFPIIGILISTVFLLVGILKEKNSLKLTSLAMIVIMALISIPVFFTGEPAEEAVEKLPGVLESLIEQHEEAAEMAFWVMLVTGLFAFVSTGLNQLEFKIAKTFIYLTFLFCLFTSSLMARAGYYGGQIRHTEIRANTQSTQLNTQSSSADED